MKLRIQGNSLRLRLTQPEVTLLHRDGAVEETVQFRGDAKLIYRLQKSAGDGEIEANLAGATVSITIPARAVDAWATSNGVRIEARDGALNIAIEKDFRCLSRSAGEEPDAFPNPAQSAP
jgi:hypothetical protein